jgi:NAD(P)-dependent dehydrogenase (short-subunit alcohol dehydrogenase family)
MGVNYFGHFAMLGRLMLLIKKSPGARVVTTSSVGEKFTSRYFPNSPTEKQYMRWFAYGDSKLATLMLALTLDDKFKREGLDAKAVSAHPGYTRTHLRTTRLKTEKNLLMRLQLKFFESLSMPAERGVLPLLYAGTSPEIQGGEYVGVSGIGEVQGDPKITRGQRKAYDPQLRRQLWDLSEQLTGVNW